ncbi:forkhead box protein P3 isoform X1 [Oryzias melastigma]|uniref:forkhead box protein P3 isoform X1 n=1 Tax=Oryzias melastigma TaxID=30732 RepID=UPI00168CCC7D|nr:forkhead box protein P3 isoform X1 [Oryzias melastigma]XP_036068888.1 forkhead box protein P3 isoform X1 [Oryzias melastigma]
MEGIMWQKQKRPSVLRQVSQTASRLQRGSAESRAAIAVCKEEAETNHSPSSSSPRSNLHLPLRGDDPQTSSVEARLHDGHLHSDHRHEDRGIAQFRVQQDIVQYMERQLALEKQKLVAMQLHLSEQKYSELRAASGGSYSLPLFLHQPNGANEGRTHYRDVKQLEELAQHGFAIASSSHLQPDLVPSIEFYKYNNIRPPYTYAYLIRWSILESPDKQRTLNDIYNWFTSMFFYFRHNSATWKNAVRHNLSLHKCFVRVEGGKGAVWTVDEREYQRRKGQKYHRLAVASHGGYRPLTCGSPWGGAQPPARRFICLSVV